MSERRDLAGNRDIWVIKAGFPDVPDKKNWSDYIFANTLKKYLQNKGHYVVVESRDEWASTEAADVVVVLRGPLGYIPDRINRDCIYIMWNLSHPEEVPEEEFNAYDLVCTGSEKESYIEAMRKRIKTPVYVLPMCIDTNIFCLEKDKENDKENEWIFVGNSRNVPRKSVVWATEHGLPLKIWGRNWSKFIKNSEEHIVADFISNDELPELYRRSKLTINDHYEDMIDNGFTNTRILEALACGMPVVSDYSETLENIFGDVLLYYKNEEEFVEQTRRAEKEYDDIKKKAMCAAELVHQKYSFEQRVQQLEFLVKEIKENKIGFCQTNVEDTYIAFKRFAELIDGEIGALSSEQIKLKDMYRKLSFQEQRFFDGLIGHEKWIFEVFVSGKTWKESEHEQREWKLEKERLCQDLRGVNEEVWVLKQKLERTYAEKSEINRKLKITYDEKYERGLEIKALKAEIAALKKASKKEIDSIKKSKTYKFARFLSLPIRKLKKIMKTIRGGK